MSINTLTYLLTFLRGGWQVTLCDPMHMANDDPLALRLLTAIPTFLNLFSFYPPSHRLRVSVLLNNITKINRPIRTIGRFLCHDRFLSADIIGRNRSISLYAWHRLMYTRAGIIVNKNCDEVILDSCQIAIRYLKSWFLMDLISSLPLDYIILLFSPQATVRQLVRAGNYSNRCCNICSSYDQVFYRPSFSWLIDCNLINQNRAGVNLKQESRAVARKPRDAAAVLFGLKFVDDIHCKFKSTSQASKARLQSSKHTGTKQNLRQNGDSRSFKVTCSGVSGRAISH